MNTIHRVVVVLLVLAPAVAPAQTGSRVERQPAPPTSPAPMPATPTPGSTINTAPTAPAPPAASSAPSVTAAATVALVTGSVTLGAGAGARALEAGDPIYERQTVVVGPNSYANLRFADGGRVLLRPNTEFTVETYRYSGPATAVAPGAPAARTPTPAAAPPAGAPGTAFFRLVRGGFRAISGLIGKADRQAYRVTTPAATIGIRGTDYEVQICTTDCPSTTGNASAEGMLVASNDLSGLQLAQAGGGSTGGGVIVATHDGSIALRTARGEFVVDVGQVALALASGQTFMLPAVPDALLLNATPSPDECQ